MCNLVNVEKVMSTHLTLHTWKTAENCSGVAEDAALNRGDNTEFGSSHAALKLLEVGAFLYKKSFVI